MVCPQGSWKGQFFGILCGHLLSTAHNLADPKNIL